MTDDIRREIDSEFGKGFISYSKEEVKREIHKTEIDDFVKKVKKANR